MFRKLLVICLSAVLVTAAGLEAQVQKYGVKSGIITFENITDLGGMVINKKSVVTFDDYGLKERRDTYDEKGTLEESFLSDGKNLYLIMHKDKTAYNRGQAYRGTEYRFSWEEIPDKNKASGEFKKTANQNIAGKVCEAYEMKNDKGTTVFAGWNGICFLTDANMYGIHSVSKAVKFEENVPVSADLFRIPAGMEIK